MQLGYASILFCTRDQCCERRDYSQTNEPSKTQFVYHQGWEEHRRRYHWTPYKTSELESFQISFNLTSL